MDSVNKVILIGKVQKIEDKTKGKKKYAVLSLSTNESSKGKKITQWHNVGIYGKAAEMCLEFLEKGRDVYVEGKIRTFSYSNEDGEQQYCSSIEADRVTFLGGAKP